MVYSSCKQQNKATGILPIRNTRRRKRRKKWEGRETHYIYYRHRTFYFTKFPGSARASIWDDQVRDKVENVSSTKMEMESVLFGECSREKNMSSYCIQAEF
jgi:hypothetical protein